MAHLVTARELKYDGGGGVRKVHLANDSNICNVRLLSPNLEKAL